jgi:hypothetical protein
MNTSNRLGYLAARKRQVLLVMAALFVPGVCSAHGGNDVILLLASLYAAPIVMLVAAIRVRKILPSWPGPAYYFCGLMASAAWGFLSYFAVFRIYIGTAIHAEAAVDAAIVFGVLFCLSPLLIASWMRRAHRNRSARRDRLASENNLTGPEIVEHS